MLLLSVCFPSMLYNKTVSRNSSEQVRTYSKTELYSLFVLNLEEQEEYPIFSFLTKKNQTTISDEKHVMKESAAVIDLSPSPYGYVLSIKKLSSIL